ncbi:T9SS type A sorting domain-containing protein [Polaribacter tangerinus]|uniref:T9SS type A sorting domain-containing protein n=1 Tax=Polaribacter tangerinus TaxID=1920034 RepID=UPI000B4A96F9|nr:T9SS type A sorting domain-containing protein [Polaribacter tangerinus]
MKFFPQKIAFVLLVLFTNSIVTSNAITTISKNIVFNSLFSTPPPTTKYPLQIYTGNKTLLNLLVEGSAVAWYATENSTIKLHPKTPLISGETYYASQTVNGLESSERVAITVQQVSDDEQFFSESLQTTIADLVTTPTPGYQTKWYGSATSLLELDTSEVLKNKTYYVEQYLTNSSELEPSVTTLFSEETLRTFLNGETYRVKAIASDRSRGVFVALFLEDSEEFVILNISSSGNISYLFGNGNGSFDPNSQVEQKSIENISDMVLDSDGNLFVSDDGNNLIYKVSPTGEVRPFVGSSTYESEDGIGLEAGFAGPNKMTIDKQNNIYVIDTGSRFIRKVTPEKEVSTLSFYNAVWPSFTVITAYAITTDFSGNLYVSNSNTIFKIAPSGLITAIAGNIDNDDNYGTGNEAHFNQISDIEFDGLDNLIVLDDNNNKIRNVNLTTLGVTTIAGNGNFEIVDGKGAEASFTNLNNLTSINASTFLMKDNKTIRVLELLEKSNRVPVDVRLTSAPIGLQTQVYAGEKTLEALQVSGENILWYATDVNGTVLDINTTLVDGETYYASQTKNNIESSNRLSVKVKKISEATQTLNSKNAIVANLNTTPSEGYFAEWFATIDAKVPMLPSDRVTNGTYYVAQSILEIPTKPDFSIFIDKADISNFLQETDFTITAITNDENGGLYVAVSMGNSELSVILKISENKEIEYIIGGGKGTFVNEQGTTIDRSLHIISDIVIDTKGNLFIAEPYKSIISKLTPSGVVSVFVGDETKKGNTDGEGNAASFDFPVGLTIDASDNLFLVDSDKEQIRKITPNRVVSTFASDFGTNFPSGGAIDVANDGTLFVDIFGISILEINPQGEGGMLIGNPESLGYKDGPASEALFGGIGDIYLDNEQNIIIVDNQNSAIRKLNLKTNTVSTLSDPPAPGVLSLFNRPSKIARSTSGNYYILDGDFIFQMGGRKSSNRVAVTVIEATEPPKGLSAQIFIGEKTLESLTVTGQDIKWYRQSAEGEVLPLSTVLESGTVYFASQTINGVESLQRLPVMVQKISEETQNINIKKSATIAAIQAQSTTGYTLKWYENSTTNTVLETDTNLTNGSTYYVDQSIHEFTTIPFAGMLMAGSENDTKLNATFDTPKDMVFDKFGNMFIADAGNHLIRKILLSGEVTTFAGSGSEGNVDGNGTDASFNRPNGLVIDSAGNIFIADAGNYLIRKITPEGEVTTFAGSGTPASTNGSGTGASFDYIEGIAVDDKDNLYVSSRDNLIRKITPEAVVTTFAGSGSNAFTDGVGVSASFNHPSGMIFDSQGNLLVADTDNHAIRKVSKTGVVTTLAGNGEIGVDDGNVNTASFNKPTSISIDAENNIYVSDEGNFRVRKIDTNQMVTTVLGNDSEESTDGVGTAASFKNLGTLIYNGFMHMYLIDENHIRKVNIADETSNRVGITVNFVVPQPTGQPLQVYAGDKDISTLFVQGNSIQWYASETATTKLPPTTLLEDETVYYASQTINNVESSNRFAVSVKKISEATQVFSSPTTTTVANLISTPRTGYNAKWFENATTNQVIASTEPINTGTYYVAQEKRNPFTIPFVGSFEIKNKSDLYQNATLYASAIAVDAQGYLYVAGKFLEADEFVIVKVSSTGIGSLLVGLGTGSFVNEHSNSQNFNQVSDMVIDSLGNLFLLESGANRIRKVTPEGVVSVFAGSETNGAQDGNGVLASFDFPSGLSIDSSNNLYVTDLNNDVLRKITPEGQVSTLFKSIVPNIPAETSIVIDDEGFIYLDIDGSAIYKISPSGNFNIVAGNFSKTIAADGIGENASFKKIKSISFDPSGNLLVLDDNKIRKVDVGTNAVTTLAGNEGLFASNGFGVLAGFDAATKITQNSFNKHYIIDDGKIRTFSYTDISNRVAVSVVVKEAPTLTFDTISKTFGDADFNLTATTNSSSEITYSIVSGGTGEVTLTGNTVSIVKAGTVQIKASVAADTNYKAAEKIVNLNIAKANQTITFNSISLPTNSDTFTLLATASSGLPVSYQSSNTSVVTISDTTATLMGIGTATITASQQGNENYNAAVAVVQPVVITTLGIENEDLEAVIKIYPNPAKDYLTIASTKYSELQVVIYDVTGRKVKTVKQYQVNKRLEVSSLSKGTYLIKIENAQGNIMMQRFIKR